jgi:hypothetical protein
MFMPRECCEMTETASIRSLRTSARADEARMKAWGKARGVVQAHPTYPCLHWLTKGRCAFACCQPPHWMDHTTAWKYDGKPAMLICQPYHIYDSDMREIIDVVSKFDVDVSIHGAGFYGYGTACIELHSRAYVASRVVFR